MANENSFDNIYNDNRENVPAQDNDNINLNENGETSEKKAEESESVLTADATPVENSFEKENIISYKSEEVKNCETDSTQHSSSGASPDYSAAVGEKTYIGTNSGKNGYDSENQSHYSNNNAYPYQKTDVNGNDGEKPQTSGIRYDADKRTGDGSYTWNYSDGTHDKVNPHLGNIGNTPKRSNNGTKVFIAAAVAFALVCTAVVSSVFTGSYVRNKILNEGKDVADSQEKPVIGQNDGNGNVENIVNVPTPSVNGTVLTKQQIAKKCKPSSVGIQTVVTAHGIYGYTYKSGGVGSGFILTQDGYIATNHHVIENADSITVQLDDGTKHEATLVGSDSVTDLAVIKIEAAGLTPMEIGDSDKMVVGDSVIAIGTPAGIEFAGTVTDGIISAINRGVEITNERGSVVKTMTLMQTNAAINPGNSGGPLINDKGQVIGINTLKLTSTYEGIGFSIPINSAVAIFNQLITDGKVSEYDSSFVTGNGAIGITNYVEISQEEAEYYNVSAGIVILQLQPDCHAYKAGLKRYDTIVAFQGKPVMTVEELNKYKSAYKAGDEVTLTVYREGVGEVDITFELDLMG